MNSQVDEATVRYPNLLAGLVFVVGTLLLCWPMLTGAFLGGPASDMYNAGYAFRKFAADFFRAHHSIPLWNPFLMGGVPYVAAGAGDVFYPTSWLRLVLPVDVAINLGFAFHLALAGFAMYCLLRAVQVRWVAAVVAGTCYQLSGIVASQVHPGHDGKLFVTALAPFLFLGILKAVRDRAPVGFGLIALMVGLCLQAHPQPAQYLLIAGAVWGAFLLFGGDGPRGMLRLQVAAGCTVAVGLGVGLYAVYALPMLSYVPFGPRGDGGPNTGWEHAISFALPANELLGTLLPKIDGGPGPTYFGRNIIKLHTEYLGPVLLVLAAIGLGDDQRKMMKRAMLCIASVFLLVALGGQTPFFRLWFEVVPLASKLRAPGMAFFLVAFAGAFLAGVGADRLLQRRVGLPVPALVAGTILLVALAGALGALGGFSQGVASAGGNAIDAAIANNSALRRDAVRLLLATSVGAVLIWSAISRRLKPTVAVALVGFVALADQYLVASRYFVFSESPRVAYQEDDAVRKMHQADLPYRVLAPSGAVRGLNPYPLSGLMAVSVPQLLGYHGNQLSTFDRVFGGSHWPDQVNQNLWRLFAVRFVVLNQEQAIPGFHEVLGRTETPHGPVVLYEADTIPPYARILAGAAKIPESQIPPTLADPRFPVDRLALFADTSAVNPADLGGQLPPPSSRSATISAWRPGRIEVVVGGESTSEEYLVVAENWYRDWSASIDGKPVAVHRAQGTLLSVALPPKAKSVVFEFRSPSYLRGRAISLASLMIIGAVFTLPGIFGYRRRQ